MFNTIINIITIITIITIINVIIESISMSIRRPGVSHGRLKDHELAQHAALNLAHPVVARAQRPVVVQHEVADGSQRPAAVSGRLKTTEDLTELAHELMGFHFIEHCSALNERDLSEEAVQQDLTGHTGHAQDIPVCCMVVKGLQEAL